ncbi:hypothetical protein D3C84_54090 [compost metagenome]
MITVATIASNGAAAPLPIEIIKGVLATMTVRGAAVATTISTIEVTPKDPDSPGLLLIVSGSEVCIFAPMDIFSIQIDH